MSICYQLLDKLHLSFMALNEVRNLQYKIQIQFDKKSKIVQVLKKPKDFYDYYNEKLHLIRTYFDLKELDKRLNEQKMQKETNTFQLHTNILNKVQEDQKKVSEATKVASVAVASYFLAIANDAAAQAKEKTQRQEKKYEDQVVLSEQSKIAIQSSMKSKLLKSRMRRRETPVEIKLKDEAKQEKIVDAFFEGIFNSNKQNPKVLLYGKEAVKKTQQDKKKSQGNSSSSVVSKSFYHQDKYDVRKKFTKHNLDAKTAGATTETTLKKKTSATASASASVFFNNNNYNNRNKKSSSSVKFRQITTTKESDTSKHPSDKQENKQFIRSVSQHKVAQAPAPAEKKSLKSKIVEKITNTLDEYRRKDYIQKNHIYRLKCRSQNNDKSTGGAYSLSQYGKSASAKKGLKEYAKNQSNQRQVIKFKIEKQNLNGTVPLRRRMNKTHQNFQYYDYQAGNANQTGVRLLKRLIFKHKNSLRINKPELFVNYNKIQSQNQDIKLIQKQSLLEVQYTMSSQDLRSRISDNMAQLLTDNVRDSQQNEKRVKNIKREIQQYEKNKHSKDFSSKINQAFLTKNNQGFCRKQQAGMPQNCILTRNSKSPSQLFLSSIRVDTMNTEDNNQVTKVSNSNGKNAHRALSSKVSKIQDMFGDLALLKKRSQANSEEQSQEINQTFSKN